MSPVADPHWPVPAISVPDMGCYIGALRSWWWFHPQEEEAHWFTLVKPEDSKKKIMW